MRIHGHNAFKASVHNSLINGSNSNWDKESIMLFDASDLSSITDNLLRQETFRVKIKGWLFQVHWCDSVSMDFGQKKRELSREVGSNL